MSKSDTWESDLLKLVFNNTTAAGIGDTTGLVGSSSAGSLYLSLHTSDPTEGGSQVSSEATYTNYQRVATARTTGAWSVSGTAPTQAANVTQVNFPQAAAGSPSNTITYVGVGTAPSTTIAVGSNGQSLPQSTINVASTTGFATSGTIFVFNGTSYQTVTYTNTTGTSFTGCSGGTGTMSTGAPVTQTGKLLYSGILGTGSLAVSQNITPSFLAGTLVITED